MIENLEQFENTQAKLRELQELYDRKKQAEDDAAKSLTLQSLKRLINQFQEELSRYRASQPSTRLPRP